MILTCLSFNLRIIVYLNVLSIKNLFFFFENMTVLSKPLSPIFDRLEKWVRSISRNVTEETDWEDSTKGSW
jgi:hypothetical protein